jgi:DNA-binding MarR family transcriptional regulator
MEDDPKTEWADLPALQQEAWVGFLRAHSEIAKTLDAELDREHGLTLSAYDVLINLRNAPGGLMRMSELAEAVLLSRSGISRLIERLEREGYVERCPVEDDSRGVTAAITDEGRQRLNTCSPTHIRGIQTRFLARLDDEQLGALVGAWKALLA